jgi:uncharacterized membrane-anchored protein
LKSKGKKEGDNMHKRTKEVLLACSIPVIILLAMCFTPIYTLVNGEEIILETVPVDPSDLFRGDYVTLRYKAEEVEKSMVEENVITELEKGRGNLKVYVLLKEEKGLHSPSKVTLEKPKTGTFLKGKLNYIGIDISQRKEIAHISYTLDKYFLEDNTGLEWEKASAEGKILARVKVNSGYAYLVDIVK